MIDFRELSIDSLTPSPTNPRKRFNEKELHDLAASIKDKGVMQPILVRPTNAEAVEKGDDAYFTYEIVAGERRYRASKLAGLETIPATVRQLDDIETLQLQIVENMQRSDLHPLEEAQALQNMLQATGSNGHKQWTHEELGTKIGKSRSYVFASLNLLKLSNFAKDKFLEDKFGRETALLISRIPGEKLQERLVKEISERELSYRAAKDYIHRDFTFELEKATWDKHDEHVLEGTPSCAKCPQRSGNYPELFPDIESPDVCTDPTCYNKKKSAYADRVIKTMPRVIHGEEAKQVAPYGLDVYITHNYVKNLDDIVLHGQTVKEILGEDAPEPFTLVDEKKNIGLVFNRDEVMKLAHQKMHEKIATGEIQPPAPTQEPEWKLIHEKKRQRAEQIKQVLIPYFKDRMIQMRDLLEADDTETKQIIAQQFNDYILDDSNIEIFLDAFGHTQINEFSLADLVVSAAFLRSAGSFDIGPYQIDDDMSLDKESYDLDQDFDLIFKATGVALPPLPAAQAQELTPDAPTAAPVADPTQAAEAAPTVETSETVEDPSPAPLNSEVSAEAARFAAIRERGEKKAAKRAAIKSQKESQEESAQADA